MHWCCILHFCLGCSPLLSYFAYAPISNVFMDTLYLNWLDCVSLYPQMFKWLVVLLSRNGFLEGLILSCFPVIGGIMFLLFRNAYIVFLFSFGCSIRLLRHLEAVEVYRCTYTETDTKICQLFLCPIFCLSVFGAPTKDLCFKDNLMLAFLLDGCSEGFLGHLVFEFVITWSKWRWPWGLRKLEKEHLPLGKWPCKFPLKEISLWGRAL